MLLNIIQLSLEGEVNSGGIYLALFTDPEGQSCWIKMKKGTFCKLKAPLTCSRNFVYNLQTFQGFCQVHFYDFGAN